MKKLALIGLLLCLSLVADSHSLPNCVVFGKFAMRKPSPSGGGCEAPLTPVTSGLVLDLELDDNTGTTPCDSSSSNLPGLFHGGVTWATGVNRYRGTSAVSLDGSTGYITVADAGGALQPGAGSFSVSAWVKLPSIPSGYVSVAGKWNTGTSVRYVLQITPSGFVQAYTQGAFGPANNAVGAVNVADGSWHMVVLTIDGSNQANLVTSAWWDGGNQTSASGAIGDCSPGGSFYIGQDANGGSFFPGFIDQVTVYNRALSGTDIANIYAQTHP